MAKGKNIRDKGKIRLSQYFKKLEDGERVAVVTDLSVPYNFPDRIKGFSGKIAGSRGQYKIVELKEGNKLKTFIVHPAHLRKL